MKASILFSLALAPLLALAADPFGCSVHHHHPDASNVMGITGTYQLKCNGVWQHLNLSYRLRKAGKTLDAGVIPRPIDAQPNQASKFYDAYLFGQNLVGDKDQLEVCIFHQATNTNGYTEPEAHHCDFV